MGKITNVILNSLNKTSGTVSNDLNYYIDWSAILKNNQKYKLTFSYQGGFNYINAYRFPYLLSNIPVQNYTLNTNTNYILGVLNYNMATGSSYIGSFKTGITDNAPLYLNSRPINNNLNIQIFDNITNTAFYDEHITVSGTGTATQSGYILTVVTATAGFITIGTVITISTVPRTVIGFVSGTGTTGTYQVDISATIGTATAYTFPANTSGNPPANYILTLSFEEISD